jgi:predicted dehydrogenase
MIRMGVIGYGYWGPNIARNFNSIDGAQVISICDGNQESLNRARKAYPHMLLTTDCNEVVTAPDIDAIAIVTPVSTHFELGKKALENGKHVFLEKPFTSTVAQAEELIELAEKNNLKVMVDHTFIFTGAVRKIKEIIQNRELGALYYYDSVRVNLGLFQSDVNVIWDLAPHDFAVMDFLIDEKPVSISSSGKAHVNGLEDTAYITAHFNNSMIAHFNVNWLSPVKVRTTLIGGEKKMLVWNDIEADEKIKVYDKGIEVHNAEGVYRRRVSYRSGDMWAPKVDQTEALRGESKYFVDCIMKDETPINDGHAGLRVVKMLDACNESIRNEGRIVQL